MKRAADEYGASINVVKEWLKGIDRAMEEAAQPKTKPATDSKSTGKAKGIKTQAKKVFTPEERVAIIKRSDEIGLHETAADIKFRGRLLMLGDILERLFKRRSRFRKLRLKKHRKISSLKTRFSRKKSNC